MLAVAQSSCAAPLGGRHGVAGDHPLELPDLVAVNVNRVLFEEGTGRVRQLVVAGVSASAGGDDVGV